MNLKIIISIVGAALLPAVSLSAAAGAGTVMSEKDGVLRREDIKAITATVVVEAIDHTTRQATLRDEDGNRFDVVVSPDVKRLNEVAAGDSVRIDYVISLLSELRPPTADEMAEPLKASAGGGLAPTGTKPAGAAGAQIKAVMTVEVLDRIHGTITVAGPNGHLLTAAVQDPQRFKAVRIGDTVVLTYTEAVAVQLVKVTPPAGG